MSARAWDRSLRLTAAAVAMISTVSVWLAWRNSTELAQRISMYALTRLATLWLWVALGLAVAFALRFTPRVVRVWINDVVRI